jgi:cytochrome c5
MRANTTQSTLLVVLTVFVLAAVGCTPTGKIGQAGSGSELVATKCTMCHPIDRINQAKHDRAGWEQTVARMRSHGAQVTDAEAAQIVDSLAK